MLGAETRGSLTPSGCRGERSTRPDAPVMGTAKVSAGLEQGPLLLVSRPWVHEKQGELAA